MSREDQPHARSPRRSDDRVRSVVKASDRSDEGKAQSGPRGTAATVQPVEATKHGIALIEWYARPVVADLRNDVRGGRPQM